MIEWNFPFSILCDNTALVRSVGLYPACSFRAHRIVNHRARNGDAIHIPCLWSRFACELHIFKYLPLDRAV
jgi:hypothetical protein